MSDTGSKHTIAVSSEEDGLRLDVLVSGKLDRVSRSRAKRLIDDGLITVDGRVQKASYQVSAGDEVEVVIPPPSIPSAAAEDIPLDVIYEDSDIIVVNKAAGMVVHPAAGHHGGTLVNALLAHCKDLSGIGGELKAGIVHRLDIGTSGVIIAAKNDVAHSSLAAQFKGRTVKKIYRALIYGSMKADSGIIDAPLGRSRRDRKRVSAHTGKAREALTEWKVLKRFGSALCLVEVRLKTGRTHQIRVHFAEEGHPLVGDPLYGGDKKHKRIADAALRGIVSDFARPALHAWRLGINHPRTGERMEFEAPLPRDLTALLDRLERSSPE